MKKCPKIEILFFYCDRPFWIDVIFKSIKIASDKYDNIAISVIDDSSEEKNRIKNIGKSSEFYCLMQNKIKLYEVGMTMEEKIINGDSIFGTYANKAMDESDSDIAFMLCDDDAVYQDYLKNLAVFYRKNPSFSYSYSHVIQINGTLSYEILDGNFKKVPSTLNKYSKPIKPYCKVDASQVSWKVKDWKRSGISFPAPQTANLDAFIYKQMHEKWGMCHFNNLISQYKFFYDFQLGKRILSKDESKKFLT